MANWTLAQKARLTRWATYASVGVAVFLLLLKLWGWWVTGSVGLLATLLDSAVDIVASVTILLAVRLAQQPPDNEHRFGHGKAEPLAAFAQSIFIAGSALYLMMYALDRLMDPQPMQAPEFGVWIMVAAMGLTLVLVTFQRYVVRATGSTAVMADSWHYLTDLGANAAVLVGLLLAAQLRLPIDCHARLPAGSQPWPQKGETPVKLRPFIIHHMRVNMPSRFWDESCSCL